MPKHYEKIGLPQRLYQTLCRLTGETAPHLVVAVSGGKDSMALLYALSEEARQKGCTLRAIHIDHGLRKQSRYEAMLVEKACQGLENSLDCGAFAGKCKQDEGGEH